MMDMGKRAGWMVSSLAAHDDTQAIFTHGNSTWEADERLASNANINMSYCVLHKWSRCMCKIRSDCQPKGQVVRPRS